MANPFEPAGGHDAGPGGTSTAARSGAPDGPPVAPEVGTATPSGPSTDAGDRQTAELAEKLRALAQTDPVLARALVAELVTALNRATLGAFGRHLSPAARHALGITDDAPLDGLEAAWAASAGAVDADG